MVLEEQITPLLDWLLPALIVFVSIVAAVSVLGFLAGYIVSASRRGPVEGFYSVAKVIAQAVHDLARFSFRRTWAMAKLAVQESLRRRVLIGFALFVVIMLFAGWYLDVKSDDPAKLYLSFVLTASNYLVLILALFLSTFSLPADIKNRTIYTIVTKPVRSLEIVLGRVLGFAAVGTVLLAAMCGVSYFFVTRGLDHEHVVEDFTRVADPATAAEDEIVWTGTTTFDDHHRHEFRVYADGTGETDQIMGHRHTILVTGEGDDVQFQIGPPEDMLQARVPQYGSLRFLDRSGKPGTGVNVGHEWAYRSYIEGGSLAAAIWTFDDVTPERYPDGFDLELDIRVFRTHKGDMERGILGSITLKNPNPAARIRSSEPIPFVAREFRKDRQTIPRNLKAIDSNGAVRDVDLYEDLTHDGRVEVWIQCSERGQYYGMAPADVYILDDEGPFWLNFVKGYAGIWMQMVLVTTFGVMFSTFLSGAVAMLATLSTISVGLFRSFIVDLFTGTAQGGGPLEATIRVLTQANLMVDLEIGRIPMLVVRGIDVGFLWFLRVLAIALPDYVDLSTASFVANGYNIPFDLIAEHLLITLGYVLVVSMIGYFFLRTRELAA